MDKCEYVLVSKGRTCSKKPKKGNNLCGIHKRKIALQKQEQEQEKHAIEYAKTQQRLKEEREELIASSPICDINSYHKDLNLFVFELINQYNSLKQENERLQDESNNNLHCNCCRSLQYGYY